MWVKFFRGDKENKGLYKRFRDFRLDKVDRIMPKRVKRRLNLVLALGRFE